MNSVIKQATTLMTVLSVVLSNFAFAQTVDQTQRASDAITSEILSMKNQGGRVEDEQGREISAAQIVTGQVNTVVYLPADGKQLKYVYKSNPETQAVTLAVLKADGTRIGARSFRVDTNLSPEQNVLRMRQTMNSLNAEIDRAVASNTSLPKGRAPAGTVSSFTYINALLLGVNTWLCARNPKRAALNCGVAAFVAAMILIDLAD